MRAKKDDRHEKNVEDGWPDEPATDITSSKLVDSASDPSSEAGQSDVKKPMEQRGTKRDRKKKVTNLSVSIFLGGKFITITLHFYSGIPSTFKSVWSKQISVAQIKFKK